MTTEQREIRKTHHNKLLDNDMNLKLMLLGVRLVSNCNNLIRTGNFPYYYYYISQQMMLILSQDHPTCTMNKSHPYQHYVLQDPIQSVFLIQLDVPERRRIMSNPIAVLVGEDNLEKAHERAGMTNKVGGKIVILLTLGGCFTPAASASSSDVTIFSTRPSWMPDR